MKRFFLLLAALLLFSARPASATLVASLNIRDLVRLSDAIIKIKITNKTSTHDDEESRRFVTYYTGTVLDCLKCSDSFQNRLQLTANTFTFKQIGQGEFGHNGQPVRIDYGVPEYKEGIYVLFLPAAHARTGLLAPVGLHQGSFRVLTQNGQESVPEFKNRAQRLRHHLQNNATDQNLSFQIDATQTTPTYKNFKTLIQAIKDTP